MYDDEMGGVWTFTDDVDENIIWADYYALSEATDLYAMLPVPYYDDGLNGWWSFSFTDDQTETWDTVYSDEEESVAGIDVYSLHDAGLISEDVAWDYDFAL